MNCHGILHACVITQCIVDYRVKLATNFCSQCFALNKVSKLCTKELLVKMTDIEFDEDGWSAVHHCVAAEKELLMSIEKFVMTNEEYLECETKDKYQRTPFLLAVERNKTKSMEKLIELGR